MRKLASLFTIPMALTLLLGGMAVAAPTIDGGDPSVRPQDDLFQAVNGGWLSRTEIPGDKRSYGTFMILREKAEADIRALIEEASRNPGKNQEARMIGDFYSAVLDVDTLDKLGLGPIKPLIDRIHALENLEQTAVMLAELQKDGVAEPVGLYVGPDEKDPDTNVVLLTQYGLGLPDREYYLKTGAESETLRQEYVRYLTDLLRMAGYKNPEAHAAQTLAFETALARIQWTRTERRDSLKTYNPVPRDSWAKDFPGFPWERFAAACGMPDKLGVIVNEPSYLKGFAELAAKTPMETWKAYLGARVLDAYAPHLDKGFREAHFHFKGEKLQGLKSQAPRWKTAVEATSGALGEAVGMRYVAKHFQSDAKAQMQVLVDNLLKVYRTSLERVEWMSPATRKAALEKLSKFRVKIGYPDQWRGYEGLEIRKGDAVGNLQRSDRFEFNRAMAEAGKPVDRKRWEMTPQTVNAYYNPVGNEIVFPAAILQPPFFDPKQDPAYNYGAIGAVIGHEISHGFDDQGSHYDGDGFLRDWWTAADQKAFEARTSKLVAQYEAYEPLPGQRVNGKLTLGENIADLTGVTMAYKAYLLSGGSGVVNGMSAPQRFFTGYARVWRSKSRPEWLKTRLLSDPHSPEQYRTNGVVTNLDTFHDAYELKPTDKLYRAPGDRIRIW